MRCDRARRLPADIVGLQLKSNYVGDDGLLVGWREAARRSEPTRLRPLLPLELMQFRMMANGRYLYPQPYADRGPVRRGLPGGIVRDSRRTFTSGETRVAAVRQQWVCTWCQRSLDRGMRDVVGDHIVPWTYGGPTVQENCEALHSACNLQKSAKYSPRRARAVLDEHAAAVAAQLPLMGTLP